MVRFPLVPLLVVSLAASAGAQTLHGAYNFTAETFAPVAQALPEGLRAAVLADPKAFLEDYRPLLSAPADLLVLVDKKNELPADYEPDDLTALKAPAFAVNRKDLRFRKAYLPALAALTAAAKKEGLKLTLSSSFRSWAYQKDLFQSYVTRDGVATAERYSARPGRSQHQLGTVIDFGSVTPEFASTKEGQWLAAHAGEYGFSLSYPEGQEPLTGYTYEPWHYRYIGVAACAVQKKWFGDLQQRLTEFQNAEGAVLKAALKKQEKP
jgi:D-alanyl-D-alanine carboxypeptidase